jgi:hypothetical protein
MEAAIEANRLPSKSIADKLREVLEEVAIRRELPISGRESVRRLTYAEITEIINVVDREIAAAK